MFAQLPGKFFGVAKLGSPFLGAVGGTDIVGTMIIDGAGGAGGAGGVGIDCALAVAPIAANR